MYACIDYDPHELRARVLTQLMQSRIEPQTVCRIEKLFVHKIFEPLWPLITLTWEDHSIDEATFLIGLYKLDILRELESAFTIKGSDGGYYLTVTQGNFTEGSHKRNTSKLFFTNLNCAKNSAFKIMVSEFSQDTFRQMRLVAQKAPT